MTVSTTSIKAGPYDGNDVATDFAYTWRIENKTQVSVYEIDSSGVSTLLTVDTDYTVGNIGVDGGGDITRVAGALPTGSKWLIVSNFNYTQETDFESQGAFLPSVHEAALDKLTYLIQQMVEASERTLQLPVTATGVNVTLPDPAAGYLIGWNDTADGLASLAPTDTLVVVQATAPDPAVFKLWYDTSTSNFKFWDGAAWQSTSGTDITGKADKVTGATNGDLAGLDASGNLTDSGVPASTVLVDGDIGTTVQAYDPDIPTIKATQAEMQAGTQTGRRSMSPKNVADAIAALGAGGTPDNNSVTDSKIYWENTTTWNTGSLSLGGSIVVPAGLYIGDISGNATDWILQIYLSDIAIWWDNAALYASSPFWSDGSNLRLKRNGGGSSIKLRKLA